MRRFKRLTVGAHADGGVLGNAIRVEAIALQDQALLRLTIFRDDARAAFAVEVAPKFFVNHHCLKGTSKYLRVPVLQNTTIILKAHIQIEACIPPHSILISTSPLQSRSPFLSTSTQGQLGAGLVECPAGVDRQIVIIGSILLGRLNLTEARQGDLFDFSGRARGDAVRVGRWQGEGLIEKSGEDQEDRTEDCHLEAVFISHAAKGRRNEGVVLLKRYGGDAEVLRLFCCR
jgi:hypothetical protein